jgi:hypothetical protein
MREKIWHNFKFGIYAAGIFLEFWDLFIVDWNFKNYGFRDKK